MKRKLFFGALNTIALLSASAITAQNFQTMPVQSGFTADVIANGIGSSAITASNDVDGVSYAFVAKDFQLTSTSTPITYGIPADGIINSAVAATPGLTYQLANLNANNSLRLAAVNDTGTLTFTTPKAAFKLYMLAVSGSSPTATTVNVVVNFTDATSQTFSGINVADWYGGTNFAIQGIGRVNRTNDALESGGGTNPRLYQIELAMDAANQSKLIQSVTVTKASGPGLPNVFAFSADVYSDCVPPTLQAASAITANSALVSWTAPTNAVSYDVYHSTSNTIPTSTTTPTYPGVTGTSTTIGGLNSNTTYYYWVRTNCSSATSQSVWSFAGTFKTLCSATTSMSENFDSYATGNIVPDCWIRLVNTTGSMSISSTTPASGTRNIYQYSASTQNPTIVVLPEFSNINAGTHWLRLKARVSTATGTLNVGYMTNPTDYSTFVSLQALSIANTVYTTAAAEYTVVVPSSVPAGARLAIKNTADGKSYYWDDVYWEPIPSCLPPTAVTVSNIGLSAADVSWTASTSSPANGYEYYYSTSSTVPTAATSASGSVSAGVTTVNIPNLNSNTTYYVWVRSACSGSDKSSWTYQVVFKTLCGSVSSMSENFDSYATGNIVPDCWVRLAGTGSQTLTATSPASGTRNVYQYTTSTQTPTIVVLPIFNNINAGTHQIKLKARISSGTGGALNIGYVTNTSDASTFVLIQTLSINNNSYATGSEYIIPIPSTIPSNARIAIYGAADSKSYYWDDVSWESTTLGTSEINGNKKEIKIYPNPFKDVLNIADTKDVKSVTVTDLTGRVVKTIDNPSKQLYLGELNAGLYLVTIHFKDGSKSTVKAIKQ